MLTILLLLVVATGLDHRFLGGESGFVSFSIAELLAYVLGLLLFLNFCARGPQYRSHVVFALKRSNGYVWIYFAWAALSALANLALKANRDALHSLKDTIPALAVFVGLVVLVSDRRRLGRTHRAVMVGLALVSVLAISQQVFGGPYPTTVDPNAYLKTTMGEGSVVAHPVVGTLGHPNGLAEFLAPLIVLSVGYLVQGRDVIPRTNKVLWFGAIGVSTLALVLTQGKAAFAWALAGTGLTLWFAYNRTRFSPARALTLEAGLMCAAVGGLFLLFAIAGHLPEGLRPGTLATRMVINYAALQEATQTRGVMGFGGGLKMFGESAAGATLKLGVHGEYLSQLLRFGLPGALLFLAALLQAVRTPGRRGWVYALPAVTLTLIYVLESGAGSQLQTLPFILCGFAAANKVLTAREDLALEVARTTTTSGVA